MRVGIGIGTTEARVNKIFTLNLANLRKPEDHILLHSEARSKSELLKSYVKRVQSVKCTHLFLVDADMEIPTDSLIKLLDHDLPIVSGLYHLRDYPFSPVAGWLDKNGIQINSRGNIWNCEYAPIPGTVVEVDWVGAACLLIQSCVLDSLPITAFSDTEQCRHDMNFCRMAREAKWRIFVDTTVSIGHWATVAVDTLFANSYHDSGMAGLYKDRLVGGGDGRYSHHTTRAHYVRSDSLLEQYILEKVKGHNND